MFYEEKVIDCVLCYRESPDDEFKPYSLEILTTKYLIQKRKAEEKEKEGFEQGQDYERHRIIRFISDVNYE